MQQIVAGMNELNERVQNAEARITEAERHAGTCTIASWSERKGERCRRATATGSKYQPQPFEGEDDKWREWARVFRSWSGRFFGGALAEIYEHAEGPRGDSATIVDLALTSLRFDAGLLRDISIELYHVLIMLTRGRGEDGGWCSRRQSRRGWKRVVFFSDGMNQS